MKKHLYLILAVTTLIAAMSTVISCNKIEPEGDTKQQVVETYEAEKALLSAASKASEITHYDYLPQVTTFHLAKAFTAADGKKYESVSIKTAAVRTIENGQDACKVIFTDSRSVTFNYHNSLSVSLDPVTEYKDYPGSSREFSFSLLDSGRGNVKFEASAEGKGKVALSYDKASNSGELTVTLSDEQRASVTVTLKATDGTNTKAYKISATAYYCDLQAGDITLEGNKGSKASVPVTVDTNLDEYDIILESGNENIFSTEGMSVIAKTDNYTGNVIKGTVIVKEKSEKFSAVTINVSQTSLTPAEKEGCVSFKDWNFKKAMLAIADKDKDNEVSEAEALQVKEINISNKGIADLTGLDAFKNAWKVNAQNNNIEDASILKELHQLYWLDLKGNRNLKTFDVTGCTQYFEHCEFEVTKELVYYTFRQQVGVTNYSDPGCQHSKHVIDNRQTTDWSNQDEIVLMKKHTAGKGYPVVFTGISYIDADMNDGSFERQMRKAMELMLANYPYMDEYGKYLDIYCVKHKTANRNQWDLANEEINFDNPKCKETYERFFNEEASLLLNTYKKFYGQDFVEQGMWSFLIECTPSGFPGRFTREENYAGFNDKYLAEKYGIVFTYCTHTWNQTEQNFANSSWTLEKLFNEELIYQDVFKNFLETRVKN